MQKDTGFTVLELIYTLALISMTAVFAVPNMAELRERSAVSTSKYTFISTLQALRNLAIDTNKHVVLCQLDDFNKCNGLSNDMVGFIDANNNKVLDRNENLMLVLDLSGAALHWRKDLRHIKFGPMGRSLGYNGTLDVCYQDLGYQIVISKVGRFRSNNTPSRCEIF